MSMPAFTMSSITDSSAALTAQKSAAASTNLMKVKGAQGASMDKINAVSQQFEAQYISQMLDTMYSSVDTKDALGGSEEEDQWRSLLNDQYGKIIAKKGGIGISSQVKRELMHLQEVSDNKTATAAAKATITSTKLAAKRAGA